MGYKVKKIYQGSNQVRPAPLYKYEYDFRNKTISQLESDGWNAFYNRNYISFNSNGMITSTVDRSVMAKIENLSSIISSATKITISLTGYFTGNNSMRFSLYNTATSSTRSGVTGPRGSNKENKIQTSIYSTNYSNSSTVSGSLTITTILDLTNGTWTTTGTNGYSDNGTLSSSDISNIKNNITGFYATFNFESGGNNNGGLSTVSLKIE